MTVNGISATTGINTKHRLIISTPKPPFIRCVGRQYPVGLLLSCHELYIASASCACFPASTLTYVRSVSSDGWGAVLGLRVHAYVHLCVVCILYQADPSSRSTFCPLSPPLLISMVSSDHGVCAFLSLPRDFRIICSLASGCL
jgi:hypothetical protein